MVTINNMHDDDTNEGVMIPMSFVHMIENELIDILERHPEEVEAMNRIRKVLFPEEMVKVKVIKR